MKKPIYKHPVGKTVNLAAAPKENVALLDLLKEYQRVLDDIYIQNLAWKYLSKINTYSGLREAYKTALLAAKKKKDFRFSDKVREVIGDFGLNVSVGSDGGVTFSEKTP